MADLSIEQQRAIAVASARARAAEADQTPESTKPNGLQDFQSTGGGAAVGNPRLRAGTFKPESDITYEMGGKVTDALASTGLPPEVAAAGGYVTNVGLHAIPDLMGMGVGTKVAPVLDATAKRLMMSSVKPTLKQHNLGDAGAAIQTMLDEGINMTHGGVAKLQSMIDPLKAEVSNLIANSPATIDRGAVVTRLYDTLDKFKNTVTPNADLAVVRKVWDEFMSPLHETLGSTSKIPVQQAQEIKSATQARLRAGDQYGKLGTPENAATKDLARGFKEEIAAAVPGVDELNARTGELVNAWKVANRRALMDDNKNPIGLGALSPSAHGLAAWLIDRSALAKSLMARGLYQGQKTIPQVGGAGLAELLQDQQ